MSDWPPLGEGAGEARDDPAHIAEKFASMKERLRRAEEIITGTLYVGGMDLEQIRALIDDAEAWLEAGR